ncbi:uncharacterized protein LOC112516964 [Cynara cardunculus var. scolymus]|uniref:Uncharacterized protein n=1 Tax=Cynara cardunculus var. scolymus TaxID=59895 RepID=A0A118JW00_CYNCS|nr:uncharacterized protein LOC112516964 [Cynara cardunculus var. scolymus]KVH94017.1 hypothetical protein Ccrd_003914 [Cynara cardunculus var. scolymus]
MKIFSWMQSKLNAKQVTKKPDKIAANNHMAQATSKEEFSDWPHSLLAIGTFGISNLKADSESESQGPSQRYPQSPTPEELQEEEELNSYLETAESESLEPPSQSVCEERDIRLQRSISGMFSRGKDILMDPKNNVIRKKSLTFLLKNMFTSRSRFNHASFVRDSLPDPTLDKSRMEKVLRAILNKKIHPQSSTAKGMPKKYLGGKEISMGEDDEDDSEGSIWVKTDSEYIVLEI